MTERPRLGVVMDPIGAIKYAKDSTLAMLLAAQARGFELAYLEMHDLLLRDGVALGIGYLIVVVIHGWLYQRVNRNIARVTPFNLATALLIIGAGIVKGWAAYVLWAAGLALLALSPLIVRVRGRFDIAPSHFAERHGSLIIIVFGESVVDIGLGAEGHPVTVSLALSAVLGLALVAALWWAYFGVGDDDRAEEAMLAADPAARPTLAFSAYFYPYIGMLLGVVALAAGVKQAVVNPGSTLPAGPELRILSVWRVLASAVRVVPAPGTSLASSSSPDPTLLRTSALVSFQSASVSAALLKR